MCSIRRGARRVAMGLALVAAIPAGAAAAPPGPRARLSPSEIPPAVLVAASVGGKYAQPLLGVVVPEDRASYGSFNDWGLWHGTGWAGYDALPKAYWVYVEPHWVLWAVALRPAREPSPTVWTGPGPAPVPPEAPAPEAPLATDRASRGRQPAALDPAWPAERSAP